MTQATLAACNAQLIANWAADPVIGRTLTGTGAPASTLGAIGDIYFRTGTKTIYGPKTNSGWGNGTSIAGAAGAAGATLLSGAVAPTSEGANGDFYIDTVTKTLYGPKAGGAWPTGASLVGTAGADGKAVLNGTGAPGSGVGVNGDFYIDTAAKTLYGPKAGGAWPTGASLIGPAGAAGKTVLSDAGAPGSGVGALGDFYINVTTHDIYGPKTGGGWGSPTTLVGGG